MHRKLAILLIYVLGIVTGGYVFSESQSRSFLSLHSCQEQCLRPQDLAGLLVSAAIQHAPGLLPLLEAESKNCVAVRHPRPEAKYHVAYLPKRDVKNIMELSEADVPYLLDCLALAREQVKKQGITGYKLITNGPDRQHLTYFHFHVIAQ
jgi:Scavenger mRNA decapping enzyme C-term binding